MLPLFDVRGKIKCVEKASNNTELISIEEGVKGTSVHFYPCVANEKVRSPFYCEVGIYSSAALKKPAIRILRELLDLLTKVKYELRNLILSPYFTH